MVALVFWFPAGEASLQESGQVESGGYEYDILAGIQTAIGGGVASRSLTLNCGWHGVCDPDEDYRGIYPRGVDIRAPGGTEVYAVVRAVADISPSAGVQRAEIVFVGPRRKTDDPDYEGCKRITLRFRDLAKRASTVTYVHVISDLEVGTTIPLPTEAEQLVRKQIGSVAYHSSDGQHESVTDGADCTSTGAHLHQEGNVESRSSAIWRNVADEVGETGGFPVYQFEPTPREKGTQFCSTLWVFKVKSVGGSPVPVGTATCDDLSYRLDITQPSVGGTFESLTAPNRGNGYSPGTDVSIRARPSERNRFIAWGGDCAGTPATSDCVLRMHGHKRVSGTFEAIATPVPTATIPNYVTIRLQEGQNHVPRWPGAYVRVGDAIGSAPIDIVWWWDEHAQAWLGYFPALVGVPGANTLTHLTPGQPYWVVASGNHTWVIYLSSARSEESAASFEEGWTGTVTCNAGFNPIRVGPTETEAAAIKAATWIINHRGGCNGDGSYTTSAPPADE